MMANDCNQNTNPLKLIHEGTRQDQRFLAELDPAYAPVDAHKLQHALVFAKAYARHLQFYDAGHNVTGTWEDFFGGNDAVLLAIAATQDIGYYQNALKTSFDFLNNRINAASGADSSAEKNRKDNALKQHLGCLFSAIASLAAQLDQLKSQLSEQNPLRPVLGNLIRSQLAISFRNLIAYHKAFPGTDPVFADARPELVILGASAGVFRAVEQAGFSSDWITGDHANWSDYVAAIAPDASLYGSSEDVFERLNHIATHNLFTAIFDQFLKAYARSVGDAQQALQNNLSHRNDHEPHYALFLAFLQLFEHARAEVNTLTRRHLDFYYREVLKLKEKPAEPGQVHLLVELARQADTHLINRDTLFKAGKDASGKEVVYAADRDFVANRAKVTALKTVYHHSDAGETGLKNQHNGRLFASPVADSDDGLGAKLTSADHSWHPFFNKIYSLGALSEIRMPKAEIGFALASHYLLLSEGHRTITLTFPAPLPDRIGSTDLLCFVSGKKDWIPVTASLPHKQQIVLTLDGSAPAITPYLAKVHGYNLDTDLPVLLVKLAHNPGRDFAYDKLKTLRLNQILLTVAVNDLKTLTVSNDFGPVDTSKPFQPFGALPVSNSSLIIGCKEAFQKRLVECTLKLKWQNPPAPYPDAKDVEIGVEFLRAGTWKEIKDLQFPVTGSQLKLTADLSRAFADIPGFSTSTTIDDACSSRPSANDPNSQATTITHTTDLSQLFDDAPDLSAPMPFDTASRHGYLRLKLLQDFGQRQYEQALIDYITGSASGTANVTGSAAAKAAGVTGSAAKPKPVPPVGPFISELTLDYTAAQLLTFKSLDQAGFENRQARFFHLAPFGQAEQHPFLKIAAPDPAIYLLPQFKQFTDTASQAAEFYIGVSDLNPGQNLALLFQLAEGTADPLSVKPKPQHIHWSYLRDNEWLDFAANAIQDGSHELLHSGIITLQIPADASAANSLLPAGQYWIKAAVASESDAVCRLQQVAAQGLTATFSNRDNDPAFPVTALAAGSIRKLAIPDAAVKSIHQPFPGFGGKGAEQADAFYTRASERLRHKDRAIALWDYEHLILEAFPQIYQAKCLNHTCYDQDNGRNIYRELAPGHVTVITVPNQQFHNERDPLRPYTSLGLLEEIKTFLQKRLPGTVQLHVKNPQFEEVEARFKVCFNSGLDKGFYTSRLNQAITRFLSPWAFTEDGSPNIGGKIYRSVLLNFVEELPYVDYVTDFQLAHRYPAQSGDGAETETSIADNAVITGSKAISILVSARQHTITPIDPVQQSSTGAACPCESV